MRGDTFLNGLIVLLLWEDAFHPVEQGHKWLWYALAISWACIGGVAVPLRFLLNSVKRAMNSLESPTLPKAGPLPRLPHLGESTRKEAFQPAPNAGESAYPSKPPIL